MINAEHNNRVNKSVLHVYNTCCFRLWLEAVTSHGYWTQYCYTYREPISPCIFFKEQRYISPICNHAMPTLTWLRILRAVLQVRCFPPVLSDTSQAGHGLMSVRLASRVLWQCTQYLSTTEASIFLTQHLIASLCYISLEFSRLWSALISSLLTAGMPVLKLRFIFSPHRGNSLTDYREIGHDEGPSELHIARAISVFSTKKITKKHQNIGMCELFRFTFYRLWNLLGITK